MGWTSYYVGSGCNRKDECMRYINGYKDKNGNPTATLIKSVMKGSTFYALMETVEKKEQFILCLLTRISKGEFYYKDIQCNPYENMAPMSLVKLFKPSNEADEKWKAKMLAENETVKKAPKFKIGDLIECKNGRYDISWGSSVIKPNETFYVRIEGHNARPGSRTTKYYVVVARENLVEIAKKFGSTMTEEEILANNGGNPYRYRSTFRRLKAKTFNNLPEVKLIK